MEADRELALVVACVEELFEISGSGMPVEEMIRIPSIPFLKHCVESEHILVELSGTGFDEVQVSLLRWGSIGALGEFGREWVINIFGIF